MMMIIVSHMNFDTTHQRDHLSYRLHFVSHEYLLDVVKGKPATFNKRLSKSPET